MKSVAVMTEMTGIKVFKIIPSQKSREMGKKTVQCLGFENRIVNQFMRGVDKEGEKSPVHQQ